MREEEVVKGEVGEGYISISRISRSAKYRLNKRESRNFAKREIRERMKQQVRVIYLFRVFREARNTD